MRLGSYLRRFSPGPPHYLFAAVFLLRLISLGQLSRTPLFLPARGDMHFYNDWAQRIVRGEVDLHHAFYGLPLYAYGLALIYRLFGYSPFIPGLLQALIDSGTAVLIYLVTLRLLRNAGSAEPPALDRVTSPPLAAKVFALLAAAAWAFFVPAEAYSIILMPTTGFVFVFWLVVWRIAIHGASPAQKECLLLGLLIGVTAMAIATVLFLIPLVIAAILIRRNSMPVRTLGGKMAVFLVGVAIGTSPCWIHNYLIARDPVFLSAHSGVNFWIGNNPSANGYPRFPPGLRAGQSAMLEDSIASAEAAAGRPLKRSEVSTYWSGKASNYISTHTSEWIRLLLIKARNFWNAFQYDDLSIITNLREQGVIFPGLYFGVVAVFGLAGMLPAFRAAPAARWIIAAVLLHMISVMTVFVTERYRLAIVPGLTIMAAYGLFGLWQRLRTGNYAPDLAYLAVVSAAAIFVGWPQRDPTLWALDAYNSGWQALETGNLALAESKLGVARRYAPMNAETNFALGNLKLAEGDNNAAATFYHNTLEIDGNHRGALNNLGVLALNAQNYDFAENWFRRAERIDPRNSKIHFLLATTLVDKGDYNRAETELEMAIALNPTQHEFTQLKTKIAELKRSSAQQSN
jgi:cytochrome c-type biogenesis protein CcmH/NrfG